jgi:hypothetical protein
VLGHQHRRIGISPEYIFPQPLRYIPTQPRHLQYALAKNNHVWVEDVHYLQEVARQAILVALQAGHRRCFSGRAARGVETYSLSLAVSLESRERATRENALAEFSLYDLPDLVKKITRNEKIAESKPLAADIRNTLSQGLQPVSRRETNRSVEQAPFIVLSGANMPAVLSEISFVSNASDEKLLQESGQPQRVAEGLYRGIAAYFDSLHILRPNQRKSVSDNRPSAASGFATSTTAK